MSKIITVLKAGKPTTAKPKIKRFNLDIAETLHRDIKMQAVKEGVALNELTAKLFNEYLSK